ncbi:hypothetical protein ACUHGC_05350 [Testudinibacter sp. P27/CKL/0425]
MIQFEGGGLFFSIRAEYKNLTKELVACKVLELKQQGKDGKGVIYEAKTALYEVLPPSSELYNIFYNPKTQILIINSNSKRSKTALTQLVGVFGLIGVKSVIVSQEKLGINTKFASYLSTGSRLFSQVGFDHEATLRRESEDDTTYRTCRHLDTETGKNNAMHTLSEGFVVQSLAMRCQGDHDFGLRFKLDENLKIRSMRFARYAEVARELRSDEARKDLILVDYLEEQYGLLNRIIRSTVLEFTQDTKLENFV